eukprot:scaffold69152_cov23-Tisochrysis_lutea.AAC.3
MAHTRQLHFVAHTRELHLMARARQPHLLVRATLLVQGMECSFRGASRRIFGSQEHQQGHHHGGRRDNKERRAPVLRQVKCANQEGYREHSRKRGQESRGEATTTQPKQGDKPAQNKGKA